ncbi:MAG: class I SAM-dependent methyltransferase [Methylocella sp.]
MFKIIFRLAKHLPRRAQYVESTLQNPPAEGAFSRYHILIDAFEQACRTFPTPISEDDENIIRNQPWTEAQYFYGGRSALKICIDALIRANAAPPQQILDFPCGHGRTLRFLSAAFPQATLYASDLITSGTKFCRDQFNSKTFVSNFDFSRIDFPQGNDLIWCGSLITHLSETRAKQVINRLTQSLSPNGILLFTTHGRMYPRCLHTLSPMLKPSEWDNVICDFYRKGYGYQVYSVPKYIETGYGFSLTSPHWIFENVIRTNDDITLILFAEKGWHEHQDVTAIQMKALTTWYNTDFL